MTRLLLRERQYEVEVLTEQTAKGTQLYIEGIFAQAEKKNGNGRIYKHQVLENAINTYNEQYVTKRRALGELNHPDRPFADPAESAVLIESLKWDGDNVIGKALVMTTPKGQIVKSLLEAGFNLGVSTRGLGSLTVKAEAKYVNDDYEMTAIDAVDNPSGPDCYVNALMESCGVWVPYEKQIEVVSTPKVVIDESLFLQKLEDHIRQIKRR